MSNNHRFFAATSAQALAPFQEAKREWTEKLFLASTIRAEVARRPHYAISPDPEVNVVGIGIGEKIVNDQHVGIRALKFFVRRKYAEGQFSPEHMLPKTVNGLPVDVEETGLFRPIASKAPARRRRTQAAVVPTSQMPNPRLKIRPAQPGCSVGFRDPNDQFTMAGTFGALVTDGTDVYVLSNNHVLANENMLPLGAPIFQPGLLDENNPSANRIAELTRFVTLQEGQENKVDCAIARALKPSLVSRDILFIGPPSGSAPAQEDMIVEKFGRTSSYTVGRISSIDTDVSVSYDAGPITFTGQIIVQGLNNQPFSAAGDSGSLILERETQKGVALLFAGSESHTIANHIEDVLQALGVTLA